MMMRVLTIILSQSFLFLKVKKNDHRTYCGNVITHFIHMVWPRPAVDAHSRQTVEIEYNLIIF